MKSLGMAVVFLCSLSALRPAQAQLSSGLFEFGWSTGGYSEAVAVAGEHAYVAARRALNVYSLADPTAPVLVRSIRLYQSSVTGTYEALGIAVDEPSATLYVAMSDGQLRIYALDDPEQPAFVRVLGGSKVVDCSISDGQLILIHSYYITTYGLADPRNPSWFGTFIETDFTPRACEKQGDYYFVMGNRVDWDLAHPQLKVLAVLPGPLQQVAYTEYPWNGSAGDILLDGSTVYLADGSGTIHVSSFTPPATITPITQIHGPARSIARTGSMLCATSFDDFEVFDVSDLGNVTPVATHTPPYWVEQLRIVGDIAYLAVSKAGLQILDLSQLPQIDVMGAAWYPSSPWQLAYHDNVLYIADQQLLTLQFDGPLDPLPVIGRHAGGPAWKSALALAAPATVYLADSGLTAVDVVDPTQPTTLGSLPTVGQVLDIALWNDRIYTASGYQGVKISDASNPASPQQIGAIPGASCYELAVRGSILYSTSSGPVLRAHDVSDPLLPVELSSQPVAASGNALKISGNLLFSCGSPGVQIFDLSDPELPAPLATIPAQEWVHAIDVDGLQLIVGDGNFVRIYDIADPSLPVEVAYAELPGQVESVLSVNHYPGVPIVLAGARDSGLHYLFSTVQTAAPLADPRSIAVTSWPNPVRARAQLRFVLPYDDDVRLELFDVAGRRIREWTRTVRADETALIDWNGRDHAGQPVASGNYFFRLVTSRSTSTGRLSVLR